MSFIDRVNECNNFQGDNFIPFVVEGKNVGLVGPSFIETLSHFKDIFDIDIKQITFNQNIQTIAQRNNAIEKVIAQLLEQEFISYVMNEPYAVKDESGEVFFVIDRSMVAYFGFRSFGQHINGFVRKDNDLFLWVAKRAADRMIFPGMLDNMVAGGLPYGLSLETNLQKECYEEAAISAELAATAAFVSTITYNGMSSKGYKPDTLYCYDLEVPETFIPVNTDGEVESFELMPVEDVFNIVREKMLFKPNCHLVLIDFFIRNGLIDENDDEYAPLQHALRMDFLYDKRTR